MQSFTQFIAEREVLDKEITQSDLKTLEKVLDDLFSKINIDINFTRHFHDRANDPRNGKAITLRELMSLFKKTYARYRNDLGKFGPDFEAVLKDINTQVNVPFVLVWDRQNQELDLVAKTIMRKKDFKTRNRELKV